MEPLDAQTRLQLLRLARSAIQQHLAGLSTPDDAAEPCRSLAPCGLFVTLRKAGKLRGCIGTLKPGDHLLDTLRRIAVAALSDPRFDGTPLSASELAELRIELSLLSALRRLDDPLDFELGVHGVYVKNGRAAGLLLPQVAREHGWDQAQFLRECCTQKAGLPQDAWRTGETEVYVFTVEHFGDT
jgi:AmmeMemoRadiSam system protein A